MAFASPVLVLGGARSGKSRFAEGLVLKATARPIYLATATAGDAEMVERIARHKADRSAAWRVIEEPLDIAQVINSEARADGALLIDCLTLWLSNLMAADRALDVETQRLIDALSRAEGMVVFVSNEVGLGIVPETALGRRFRDEAGRLNQALAAMAQQVVFMAAGLPMVLKGPAP